MNLGTHLCKRFLLSEQSKSDFLLAQATFRCLNFEVYEKEKQPGRKQKDLIEKMTKKQHLFFLFVFRINCIFAVGLNISPQWTPTMLRILGQKPVRTGGKNAA